ncbi:homeobox and leucine zipper encoding b [Hoplias malabaricus]|uniref:homeobox and leucine zipper encoding b n=1 Tax=Hoplias malabaricus TaxID=27720 RepID=UPI003462FC26
MERSEPPRSAEVGGGESGRKSSSTTDGYDCRICGYKAADVGSLSQHLRSVHPVTSLSTPTSRTGEKSGGKEVEDALPPLVDGEQSPDRKKSPPGEKPEVSEGSSSSLPKDSEECSRSACIVQNQVPEMETKKNASTSKASQSPLPASVLPQRKALRSSGSSKENQSEHTASSGTSSLNRTHLVCLPLVSEGLKLVWVRSEQTHELDTVSELVEAFNAFPYPTEQEANALARRCSLSTERVKVWFMMQRVRYGISWGDDDIRETRRKLHHLHKMHLGEEYEEEKEDVLSDDLAHEKEAEGLAQGFKHASEVDAYAGQMHHTPSHGSSLSQHGSIDYNGSAAVPQYTNGLEQFVPNTVQAQSTFEHSSLLKVHSQPNMELKHIPPIEPETQSPSAYSYVPTLNSINHSSLTQYQSSAIPIAPPKPASSRAPAGQLRKKSKAQLMVLRRSFVHRNWPSEAEVQRLQRVTGLGRHEIRKWFADSRYQLRRSGRSWLTEDGKRSQRGSSRHRKRLDDDVGGLYEGGEAVGSEGFEIELDVDMDDEQDSLMEGVSSSETRKEGGGVDLEIGGVHTALKRERKEIAIAPSPSTSSSSPSPSFIQGRVLSLGPETNLRKKTQQQLDVLRQSFLHCQWPTSEDYTTLQRKTGLTRTEIVQWFGDTRYHVKHNNMRWMSPEDRERIIAGITKQQKKGGRPPKNKKMVTDHRFEDRKSSNGTGVREVMTWNSTYEESSSVLPGGEL